MNTQKQVTVIYKTSYLLAYLSIRLQEQKRLIFKFGHFFSDIRKQLFTTHI